MTTPGPADPLSCDFEDHQLCGYQQDQTDQYDWTRKAGTTSTVGSGPTNDHTYGTSRGEQVPPSVLMEVTLIFFCEVYKSTMAWVVCFSVMYKTVLKWCLRFRLKWKYFRHNYYMSTIHSFCSLNIYSIDCYDFFFLFLVLLFICLSCFFSLLA